jgi:hypothetical protein
VCLLFVTKMQDMSNMFLMLDIFTIDSILEYLDFVSATYVAQTCHWLRRVMKSQNIWYKVWSRARMSVCELKHHVIPCDNYYSFCRMVGAKDMHKYISSYPSEKSFIALVMAACEKRDVTYNVVDDMASDTFIIHGGVDSEVVPNGKLVVQLRGSESFYCVNREHWINSRYTWPKMNLYMDYHRLCMVDGNRVMYRIMTKATAFTRGKRKRRTVTDESYDKADRYLALSREIKNSKKKPRGRLPEPRVSARMLQVYSSVLSVDHGDASAGV